MKEKINKFMKKVKRIFGKIIKDKQLLGIFLLCIAVICAGILVIGLLKTMLIIFVLVVLGLITKFVIDYKNKKENIISKTTNTNDVTNDISVTDTTNTINENIGSEDEKVMKKKSRKKIIKKAFLIHFSLRPSLRKTRQPNKIYKLYKIVKIIMGNVTMIYVINCYPYDLRLFINISITNHLFLLIILLLICAFL